MNAISSEIVLALLTVCMIGEAILAALYLSTRSLSIPEILGWGMVIVLVPLLGPFLAIAIRPGRALQPARGGRAAPHRRP
jgi:hypothetical protein